MFTHSKKINLGNTFFPYLSSFPHHFCHHFFSSKFRKNQIRQIFRLKKKWQKPIDFIHRTRYRPQAPNHSFPVFLFVVVNNCITNKAIKTNVNSIQIYFSLSLMNKTKKKTDASL